jgi:hypothetical protein
VFLVTCCIRLGLSPEGGLGVGYEWNNPRRMCYLEGYKSEWCTDNLPMVFVKEWGRTECLIRKAH